MQKFREKNNAKISQKIMRTIREKMQKFREKMEIMQYNELINRSFSSCQLVLASFRGF